MSWKSIADLLDRRCGAAGRPARRADGGGLGDARPLRSRAGDGAARRCSGSAPTISSTGWSSISPSAMPATCRCRALIAGRRLRADPRRGRGAAPRAHALTILLGGNNAVTRPAAHGLGLPLDRGRPDHARRPFRHARDRQRADERQSGPLPARGRPARRATSARSASPPSPIRRKMHEDALAAGIGIFDHRPMLEARASRRRSTTRSSSSAMSRRSSSISTST